MERSREGVWRGEGSPPKQETFQRLPHRDHQSEGKMLEAKLSQPDGKALAVDRLGL